MNNQPTKFFRFYEKYMLVIGILGQSIYYIQAAKIFMTKCATGVSISAFIVGFIAVTSWAGYGFMLKNRVLIISNLIAVIGALFVILGIMIHGI